MNDVEKWIPCSEKLPLEDGWYLITAISFLDIDKKPFCSMTKFNKGKFESPSDVIAWMPLPEPYKGNQI